MTRTRLSSLIALALFSTIFSVSAVETPKEADFTTRIKNSQVLDSLPVSDVADFNDAHRGFIAPLPGGIVKGKDGRVVWNLGPFDFLETEKAPDTVNPSLWRIARLNMENGLYKVTDRIYQVRGVDLANMTIIEGNTGLILIDPLTSRETAAAALKLYYDNIGKNAVKKPVKAVIYSHSHIDHYGGVRGVIDEKDVKTRKIKVLAPAGFLEAAISENVYAGNAMSRRAQYMYGLTLPKGSRGHVDAGLGKSTALGTPSLIAPTDTIHQTGETRTIDGITIEFQMAPGTEAPAEMLMYFPQFKALCAAEDATHTMHNLYTLRGAQVRDANRWWKALDETVDRYGDKTEVLFAQHHWPRWGKDSIATFLKNQRDGYKFLHDQTLRLANQGYTPAEIGEMIKLPPELAKQWYMRDYYGTVNHNVKAVYQYYLGWYDGNPSNLYPLPPVEAAKRYVDYMGGADRVIQRAKMSYGKGDFRWVAEVMKHVVFADPHNTEARHLLADAYEQLGYQAESGPWRAVYLTGAQELRNGVPKDVPNIVSPDVVKAMTPEMVLSYLAIHVNPDKMTGKTLKINWKQPGSNDVYALSVENGVLLYKKGKPHIAPDMTLTLPAAELMAVASGQISLKKAVRESKGSLSGNPLKTIEFTDMLDRFNLMFPIVTP